MFPSIERGILGFELDLTNPSMDDLPRGVAIDAVEDPPPTLQLTARRNTGGRGELEGEVGRVTSNAFEVLDNDDFGGGGGGGGGGLVGEYLDDGDVGGGGGGGARLSGDVNEGDDEDAIAGVDGGEPPSPDIEDMLRS